MKPTINIIQEFYGISVGQYRCHACSGTKSKVEHTPCYTIIFLLEGSFRHLSFRDSALLTSETVMFKKPGFEYQAVHEHYIHDNCLYIEFNENVLEMLNPHVSPQVSEFLKNDDRPSILLQNDPWKNFITWQLAAGIGRCFPMLQQQALIIELIRELLGQSKLTQADNEGVLHDSVDKAKKYMAANFIDDISIEDVADASHISPFHFIRVFKRDTALSPHKFLLNIRISSACRLLRDTILSMTDVCFASGFNSLDYFDATFKRTMGMTPSQYRTGKSNLPKLDMRWS
jgi:AraC family transcriptional regulator